MCFCYLRRMPYREIAPTHYYHVYNRSSHGIEIFKSKKDYFKFIDKLHDYALKLQVGIIAYCIMPNHFHLLLKEPDIDEKSSRISALMHRLSLSYSKHYAIKYKHAGVLYQSPFKSKLVLDDCYFDQLKQYILDNPVRKGLVRRRYNWPYSYPRPGL